MRMPLPAAPSSTSNAWTAKGRAMAAKKPTAPQSLVARAIARENERHARRLAEIKRAEAMLHQFEPVAAALEARNIHLCVESFHVNYMKALDISSAGPVSWSHGIYDALIELGFTEVQRDVTSYYAHVLLKQGRLKLYLMIEAAHAPAKPEAK